jgi:hypothetical protein
MALRQKIINEVCASNPHADYLARKLCLCGESIALKKGVHGRLLTLGKNKYLKL